MTFREFLSERINRMIIQIVFAAAASAFLLSTGTQPGILLLLLIFCLLITTAIYLSDFFRQRARLRELGAILNGLDQKYLFTECVPPASAPWVMILRMASAALSAASSIIFLSGPEKRPST